ncbi:MAG TPA: amidohydrolase family protein, partial [Pseudoxanthomonas sp.]|nr:amidohydrolase family protein [Pseudoxanthomonas sp.]
MLSAAMVAVPVQVWAAKVTVLSAARIHTMDTSQPRAQAMAFDEQGRILVLGDTAALLKRYPDARRLDVGSATVIPGLIDAHAHVSGLGFSMMGADLTGTRDKNEIFARLKAKAAGLKPGEWLLGGGWDQNDWPEKTYPSAAELDALFPDRPVWLSRIDGHAGWANSAAMRAVSRDLSGDWQPDGGVIRRDAAGKPTGILV